MNRDILEKASNLIERCKIAIQEEDDRTCSYEWHIWQADYTDVRNWLDTALKPAHQESAMEHYRRIELEVDNANMYLAPYMEGEG